MPRPLRLLPLLAVALCFSSRGPAEDIADLFAELEKTDAAAEGETADGEDGVLEKLGENLGGAFTVKAQHFWSDPAGEEKGVNGQEDLFESRLRLGTWTEKGNARFTVGGWLEGGNEDRVWRGYDGFSSVFQEETPHRHHLELNELYLRVYLDAVDLTFGKMVFKNGISPGYSPADKYGPSDDTDPLDSRDLGFWLAQADLALKGVTITGALFPVYQPSILPCDRSRWMNMDGTASSSSGLPAELQPRITRAGVPDVSADNLAYFLRARGTLGGWGLFASAYYGLSSQEVFRGTPRLVNVPVPGGGVIPTIVLDLDGEIARVWNAAGGFSTTRGKLELHGEAIYSHSLGSKDDDFVTYGIGCSYNLDDLVNRIHLDKLKLFVDYAGESVTRERSAEGSVASSRETRFGGKDFYIGDNDLITGMQVAVTEDLEVTLLSLKQLAKDGLYLGLKGTYRFGDKLSLTAGYDRFDGSAQSFLGRWDSNDRVVVSLEYAF